MTRTATVLLLAFALAACDAEAPLTSATDTAPAPVSLASMKSADDPFVVNENAAVRASGETVLLRINGDTVEMTAGQAYLIGEALTRAGYDTMSSGLQEALAPRGGKRCDPPKPGTAVTAIDGRMYKRCPPPPPPPFLELSVLDVMLDGTAEIVEAPEDAEWQTTAGGLFAD